MRTVPFLTALILLAGCDFAGRGRPVASDGLFRVAFGGGGTDWAHTVAELPEGALLVAGMGDGVLAPADGTLPTPALAYVRRDGEVGWRHVYEELRYADADAAVPYGDGYRLLVSRSDDRGDYGGGIQEVTTMLWSVGADGTLGEAVYERAGAYVPYAASQPLTVTQDGGFVLLVEERVTNGPNAARVVKLGAGGQLVWEHTLRAGAEANAVLEADDGDILVAGTVRVEGETYDTDILLSRLSSEGIARWTETYGAPGRTERGQALAAAADGYVVAGTQYASDCCDQQAYAVRVDTDGAVRWAQEYGRADAEEDALGITALPDEGFVLAGRAGREAFLTRIDPEGVLQWDRRLGAAGRYVHLETITALSDGRLAAAGATGPDIPSYGGSDFDTLVLVLSAEGTLP